MSTPTAAPDPVKIEALAGKAIGYLGGMMVSLGVWLGDELGLYRAMAGAGPMDSAAVATKTGLDERWVREWLSHQASAGLVEHRGGLAFQLSPEAALMFADESSPASLVGTFAWLPSFMAIGEELPGCFRTGMGRKYDAHGRAAAAAMQRGTAPTLGLFTELAFPALDGLVPKLEAGARVADIGCGGGGRLIAAAAKYPQSEFHGYEISQLAIDLANENLAKAGLTNLSFHNSDVDPLPADNSFDLICFGDVVHDLARPDVILAGVRAALKPDGTVLVIDVAAGETLEENLANPMAPLLYGFSQLICMSSSLSQPDGMGIGTLGLSPSRLRGLAEGAGFSRFRVTEVEDVMNSYYEIRP